jgi:hypothetical protein
VHLLTIKKCTASSNSIKLGNTSNQNNSDAKYFKDIHNQSLNILYELIRESPLTIHGLADKERRFMTTPDENCTSHRLQQDSRPLDNLENQSTVKSKIIDESKINVKRKLDNIFHMKDTEQSKNQKKINIERKQSK